MFVSFVDFGPLESLILVLPPAREHNFYKIDVFRFVAKFGPKIMVLKVPNYAKSKKIEEKKVFQNKCFFNIDFLRFFVDSGSQVEVPKGDLFCDFFPDGPTWRPGGAQEAPRAPQEAPRGSKRLPRAPESFPF